jgi:hypothetical protein
MHICKPYQLILIAAESPTSSCTPSPHPLLAPATERSSVCRVRAHHDTEASAALLTATATATTHRHSSLRLTTPLSLTTIVSTKYERFVALLLGRREPHHLRLVSLPRVLRLRKSTSLSHLIVPGGLSLLYLLLGLSSTLHYSSIHSWLCSCFATFAALLRSKANSAHIFSPEVINVYLHVEEYTLRMRFACCCSFFMFASRTTLLFPLPTFTPVTLPFLFMPGFIPGFFFSVPFIYVFLSALTTSAADGNVVRNRQSAWTSLKFERYKTCFGQAFPAKNQELDRDNQMV